MRRWAGLDSFLFLILLASHNNTKQLGLLIFLSSKVRWANDFFIATKKKSNELT
jgi:predicted transcriptional regulator